MEAPRTEAEDLSAFLSGLEFGLTALEGRLHRAEDPSPADLQEIVDEYRRLADRMRTRAEACEPETTATAEATVRPRR